MSIIVLYSAAYINRNRLGLWYLTSLSPIFHLYRGCQFYWRRKPEYPEKITRRTLSLNVVSGRPCHERDSNLQR